MSGKLNCIDLFCGCGGLSKGFLDAGYNVLLGIDFDDAALKTFSLNHGNAKALKLDLFNHDNIKVITDYLEQTKESLDVLIGGPPCQGFSIAGPRDMNDKRNLLYLAMVKLAERTKPKAILLENVPGMVQTNDGIGAKRIVEDFAKIGVKTSKVMPSEEDVKTEGRIVDIVSGVIRGETISQEKLDEIIRKVKLALGDA